jgi:hypothetical protein
MERFRFLYRLVNLLCQLFIVWVIGADDDACVLVTGFVQLDEIEPVECYNASV